MYRLFLVLFLLLMDGSSASFSRLLTPAQVRKGVARCSGVLPVYCDLFQVRHDGGGFVGTSFCGQEVERGGGSWAVTNSQVSVMVDTCLTIDISRSLGVL